MRSFRTSNAIATFASLATAFALAACSDVATAPNADIASPSFIIGTTVHTAGSTAIQFASNATTSLCGFEAFAVASGVVPATTPINSIPGCLAAIDLQAALAVYNPGWDANFAGSSWIGNQATANQYLVPNGVYRYTTVVNIPAGATGIVLNDSLKSDNAVAVYVNGTKLETQVIADCRNTTILCNWKNTLTFVVSDNNQAHFVAGANQITVLHYATPIGWNTPVLEGKNCGNGPQANGEAGFSGVFNVPTPQKSVANGGTWSQANCENPAALNFTGNVSYVPSTPPPTLLNDRGCSPGYWKNHNFPTGYTKGQLFSSVFANAFPGMSLQDVLSQGGGGLKSLGRHTVSAYFNAVVYGVTHYGLTPAQVVTKFNAAFASGNYGPTSDEFESMEDVGGRTCTDPTGR